MNKQINTYHILLIIIVTLLVSAGMPYAAGNYITQNDVISGGGGKGSSTYLKIEHTTGQSSPIGNSESGSYLNFAGFWNTLSGGPGMDYQTSGSGSNYPEPGFLASLTLDVSTASPGTGWFDYFYSKLRMNVQSTTVTSVLASEGTVTIESECSLNGTVGNTCILRITEGSPDSFKITIYNPDGSIYFDSGSGTLESGNFSITQSSPNQYQLITLINPSGAGSIRPDCTGGCPYDPGDIVNLDAEDNAGYMFTSWTGCDSESGHVCTMTMDADKSVTANYEACLGPIRIGETYYPTIQAAYTAAPDGSTIEIELGLITEDLNFDRDISITLKGGNNCRYTAVTGFTMISGSIVISNGTVTTENFILE